MRSAFNLGSLLFLSAICVSPVFGQAAPYLLPYTMSTYAGPSPVYTVGQTCANGVGVALDADGDGCLASTVSVGIDPHDLRVDPRGNLYWEDNTSGTGVVHKISPYNHIETIYFGSPAGLKNCAAGDKFGNGCTSTDGATNSGPSLFTPQEKANRGLGMGPNGDLILAGYNLSMTQRISAFTDLTTLVAGTGTASYVDGLAKTSQVSAARGAGEDAYGNVYIADTGNNELRVAYNGYGTLPPVFLMTAAGVPVTPVAGNVYTVTGPNGAATKTAVNGPAISALLSAPEDVQVDVNGNIFIADAGNNMVRAIYMGKGNLPGITAPVFGNIYNIAGCSASSSCTAVAYPAASTYASNGTTPTVSALTVAISDRKISLDNHANLFIADVSNNVIWFVDNATGNIRVIAGNFGGTAGAAATGCAAKTDTVGDGCPGPLASIYTSAASNSGVGTSSDYQGDLYISDNEGAANAAGSRIRKLLSGLNFPAVKVGGTAVTQTVLVHFAPNDIPSETNPFTIAGNQTDFTLGTPACTVEADFTDDCAVPITFNPTVSGYETATLTVTPSAGPITSFLITGTGTAPTIAFDPGNISLSSAAINGAQAVSLDGAGNTYIADTANNRILITPTAGVTRVFAGGNGAGYTGDGGAATAAALNGPRGVTIDTSGSLYIADTGNNVIRKVDATGQISTYAGGAATVCAFSNNTRGDGCPALQATFNAPTGLAADNLGQLYVADSGNNVIRQISTSTYVSTLAGGAANVCTTSGGAIDTLGDSCSANATVFLNPTGIAFDATGQSLFVADTGDHVVRKISLNNSITTTGTGTATKASSVLFNPVTLVAGDGQAGSSVDANSTAILSHLNAPTGVASDAAGNIYIADTGNSAIRLVNNATGQISTIVGILGSSGAGSATGSAVAVQLNVPAAVAVAPNGSLTILDSGNNRVVLDARTTVTFNFGRVNVPTASPVQNFTELNIGVAPATLGSTVFTATGDTTQFTLTPGANSSGTIPACSGTLAPGAICNIQGQFTPTAANPTPYKAVFTENGTAATGNTPSITLIGTGAILTPTTATVAQTVPATGNSQFGGSVTLTATIASACNTAAPGCVPTGTVSFVIDGTATAGVALGANGSALQTQQGLSVGTHTISCNYSGDDFYAASSCANLTITVAQASTTSVVTATPNNQPQFPTTNCVVLTQPPSLQGDTQCTATTLSATVTSNTTGSPTGTVTFFATGGPAGTKPVSLGSASLNPATGVASLALTYITDLNHLLVVNSTLLPGTYTLTCTYSGAANYAVSNCPGITFTVAPQPVDFTLVTRGCSATSLDQAGTSTPGEGIACPPSSPESFKSGVPLVSVAQGSTTDATIFINANNTFTGTLSFSCSGLPANSICTFSPTSVTFAATTNLNAPIPVDMTLWTDLQPGADPTATAAIRTAKTGVTTAFMLGWPLTLLGLAGIFRFRRKAGAMRGLSLLALLLTITGSSLVFTGCGSGGPGAYKPSLTPAGTYPITVTVKGASTTHTTIIYWTVTAPGIPGQE